MGAFIIIKKIKKAAAVFFMPIVCAALCSCTVFSSAENLLTPPALSEEQAAVYKALCKETGKNINLVFPSSGDIRSAYVFSDFDSDGDDEAAVFYRLADGGENSVRVNILDKTENGSWRSVYDLSGKGEGIGTVRTETVGGSGKIYLCTEYELLAADNKILEIYSYENNRLKTIFSDSCTEYFITDFNGDGKNELTAAVMGTENEPPRVYMAAETDDGTIKEVSAARLVGDFTEIQNITPGLVGENTPALFIDESSPDGRLSTEIVYSVSGILRNPSDVENSTVAEDTKRGARYFSMDCDGDGIVEIPVTETAPGYENSEEKLLLTKWCVFYNYGITEKYIGWYNMSKGYSLMFPGRWEGLVTVRTDASTGESVFCRYDGSVETSTELLRITSCEKVDTELYMNSGWQLILGNESADFLVKFSDDENEPLVLTMSEIMNNFFIY